MSPSMYLFKVNICLTGFYLLYIVLFRNTTFFKVNRFYLMGGLLLSFIIPLVTIPFPANGFSTLIVQELSGTFKISEHSYDGSIVPGSLSTKEYTYTHIIYAIYFSGVAFLLGRLLQSLFLLFKIKRRALVSREDNIPIIRTGIRQPFSFFNFIFLPEGQVNEIIIEHEKVHVRQMHWIDLIFVELATVFLWFNPVIYAFKRSVKLQHEYLADSGTLTKDISAEQYLNLILEQIQTRNFLTHNFNSQSIKKRIHMITQQRTSRKFYFLYMTLVPAICLLMFSFSKKPVPGTHHLTNKGEIILIIDPGHGGSDLGGQSRGLNEKDLTLSIAKLIQKEGEEKGIRVILTRTEDETVALRERISISGNYAANIFISLHFNNDQSDPAKSGIECIVSENNAQFEKSKTMASQLLQEFKSLNGIEVKGVRKTDAYVLKNNTIPAVALELGYLSNSSDYAFLSDENNQKFISRTIISSVINFSR